MTVPSVVANGTILGTASATSVSSGSFPSSHTATTGRLLLCIHSVANTGAVTTPTDYTLLAGPYTSAGNKQINVYGKVAVGGETSVTVTQPNARGTVELFEIQDADAAGIVALTTSIQAVQTSDTGSVTSLAITAIDPTSAGDVLMVAAIVVNTNLGTAGSATSWASSSYVNQNLNLAASRQATGVFGGTNLGSTGTTATWTNAGSVTSVHFVIPAAAGTTPTPTVVAGAAGVPAPTVQNGSVVAATVVAGTAAIGSMGAELTATVDPSSVALTATIPTPTFLVDGLPTIRVELAARSEGGLFDFFILDESLVGDTDLLAADTTTLIDITAHVRSVSIHRGRMRDIDEFRAGTCTIQFNNDTRQFDPTNTESALYGNLEPMRVITVTAVVSGADYPLFHGYVQNWNVDYGRPGSLPIASVFAADSLSILANQDLATIASAHSGDLPGARILRVLDRPEVAFPSDLRDIATGVTTFGATTFGTNAARYLQLCAQSEGGSLYVSKTGKLTFEQRNTVPASSSVTFSDDGASTSVGYMTIDQDISTDLLYNRVIIEGTTGNEQIAEDDASQDAYFVRTLSRTGLFASSDADMADLADLLLGRFATPELRLRQVSVNVDRLPAARQVEVLGLELTDRATAVRTLPTGTPATITQETIVNGLDWTISQGATDWTAVITLEAGSRAVPFILDDAALGVLDANYLGS